jgi:hypothetical protein
VHANASPEIRPQPLDHDDRLPVRRICVLPPQASAKITERIEMRI